MSRDLRPGSGTLFGTVGQHQRVFTGIIETTGTVVETTDDEGGRRLRIAVDAVGSDAAAATPEAVAPDVSADEAGRVADAAVSYDDLHHGQSISVSGVCLTVEAFRTDPTPEFEVFLAAETVEKTYLGSVEAGDVVNLERALAADGRFDGHLVQGHVDTTTEITGIERVGDDWVFEFDLPETVEQYVVGKGSIAIDGISLTVAERSAERFAVAIIPTTYDRTNLSEKSVGDPVHLEVDVIAKYVERMLAGYADRIAGE
jgi:riboflavin synthase